MKEVSTKVYWGVNDALGDNQNDSKWGKTTGEGDKYFEREQNFGNHRWVRDEVEKSQNKKPEPNLKSWEKLKIEAN